MGFVLQKLKEIRERSRARIESFIKEVREKGIIGATLGKLIGGGSKGVAAQLATRWKFPLLRVTTFAVLKTLAGVGKILFGKIPFVQALEQKASEIIAPLKEIKLPKPPKLPKAPIRIPARRTAATATVAPTAKGPEPTYKLY